MGEFWISLDSFEKILWAMALPASVIFVVQSIMTFMGMDAHDGMQADVSGGTEGDPTPFQLFTIRSFINFILGFSWTGISLYGAVESKPLIVFLSTLGGIVLAATVMLLLYLMSKLESSGNITSPDAVGRTGIVYVPIAGHKNKAGKVQITVKGAVREFDALTEGEYLKTGEPVVVKSIVGESLLLVERI
jgi:membrane protein implicated in regulation of membrane protease activity